MRCEVKCSAENAVADGTVVFISVKGTAANSGKRPVVFQTDSRGAARCEGTAADFSYGTAGCNVQSGLIAAGRIVAIGDFLNGAALQHRYPGAVAAALYGSCCGNGIDGTGRKINRGTGRGRDIGCTVDGYDTRCSFGH